MPLPTFLAAIPDHRRSQVGGMAWALVDVQHSGDPVGRHVVQSTEISHHNRIGRCLTRMWSLPPVPVVPRISMLVIAPWSKSRATPQCLIPAKDWDVLGRGC